LAAAPLPPSLVATYNSVSRSRYREQQMDSVTKPDESYLKRARRAIGYVVTIAGILVALWGISVFVGSRLGLTTPSPRLEQLALSSGTLLLFLGWASSSAWRLFWLTGLLYGGVVFVVSFCIGFCTGWSGIQIANPLDGLTGTLCLGTSACVLTTMCWAFRHWRGSRRTPPGQASGI
jgi:hypothetical protein